jgi:hypothetical protein
MLYNIYRRELVVIMTMVRKRSTYTLDETVLEAFKRLAQKSNMSMPRYLETLMIEHSKSKGELPDDYQPIGETRGSYQRKT